jgi:hypothetical protein
VVGAASTSKPVAVRVDDPEPEHAVAHVVGVSSQERTRLDGHPPADLPAVLSTGAPAVTGGTPG